MFLADYFDDGFFDVEYWGSRWPALNWSSEVESAAGWDDQAAVSSAWVSEASVAGEWEKP